VYKIAKKWLGDRVQFWHEMNETGDHRQWGYYDWNEVYAVRRRMKEQEGKVNHENEGILSKNLVSDSPIVGCPLVGTL
jgi:hypothetical protein